jgi:hypothetical protein
MAIRKGEGRRDAGRCPQYPSFADADNFEPICEIGDASYPVWFSSLRHFFVSRHDRVRIAFPGSGRRRCCSRRRFVDLPFPNRAGFVGFRSSRRGQRSNCLELPPLRVAIFGTF